MGVYLGFLQPALLREVRSFVYKSLLFTDDNDVFAVSKPSSNNHTALRISLGAFKAIISVALQNPGDIIFVLQFGGNRNPER